MIVKARITRAHSQSALRRHYRLGVVTSLVERPGVDVVAVGIGALRQRGLGDGERSVEASLVLQIEKRELPVVKALVERGEARADLDRVIRPRRACRVAPKRVEVAERRQILGLRDNRNRPLVVSDGVVDPAEGGGCPGEARLGHVVVAQPALDLELRILLRERAHPLLDLPPAILIAVP